MDPITIGLALASQFAPSIVKYFTNSDTAASVAEQVIGIAQTVTGKTTGQEALEAIKLDPALAISFKTAVMQNETELEKAYLADIQNARNRDVEIIKSGHSNIRANTMATLAVAIVCICLMVVVWKTGMDEYAKASISLITGRALGWVEQVFSFEFGSTRDSKKKDDTISNLSK